MNAAAVEVVAAGAGGGATRLECGVCWNVYDPAQGDEVWQIAPGTAFEALPAHWRCPVCDSPKDKFLRLDAGEGGEAAPVDPERLFVERVAAVERAYRDSDARMRGLPVHNAKLGIDMVGFRRVGEEIVGVVVAPWFINLVVLALDPAKAPNLAEGSKRRRGYPSGIYEFIVARLDGVGVIETLSLFSPVFEFDDPAVARIAAQAAADGLFEVEAASPEADAAKPAAGPAAAAEAEVENPARRSLLFGR